MKRYIKYFAFAITAFLMVLLFPMQGKFNYQYQKGSPWVYETLISEIDFPILKSGAEIFQEKEAKASQVIDCYKFDDKLPKMKIGAFEKNSSERNYDPTYVRIFSRVLTNALEVGLVSNFEDSNISDKVILISRDKRIKEKSAKDVYTVEQVYNDLKLSLYEAMTPAKADSLILAYRPELYLIPNLTFDKTMTELFHQEAVNYISPSKGIVYAGQLIVSNGELVTAEIEQLLDSYKAEYEKAYGIEGSYFTIVLSHVIFVVMCLLLLYVCLYFIDKRILDSNNKIIFILFLVFVSFAATAVINQFKNGFGPLVFPYAAIALYLFSFFNNRIAFPIYIIAILPILTIFDEGIAYFFIHLTAGSIALTGAYSFSKGWKQFLNALFIFVGMFAIYVAFRLGTNTEELIFKNKDVLLMGISSILVVMSYPFAFLFEKVFSLVSHSKLWELSDTNSTLLREMARLAPGSFQHSLQVANLAEEATRQVGGYPMLARVGALYHDIGKMENPLCFVENQLTGEETDFHKGLTPEASAREILRHVDDGMALARKYSLPEVVSDFIRTHHGKTVVRFFYTTWCNNGGDPAAIDKFTYDGMLPQTKEQAILMMADSIEAASRTLKNYSTENISQLVDKIVDGKMAEKQFIEADITLKEIDIVKESFKTYLQQIYHARIAYPKRKRQALPEAGK